MNGYGVDSFTGLLTKKRLKCCLNLLSSTSQMGELLSLFFKKIKSIPLFRDKRKKKDFVETDLESIRKLNKLMFSSASTTFDLALFLTQIKPTTNRRETESFLIELYNKNMTILSCEENSSFSDSVTGGIQHRCSFYFLQELIYQYFCNDYYIPEHDFVGLILKRESESIAESIVAISGDLILTSSLVDMFCEFKITKVTTPSNQEQLDLMKLKLQNAISTISTIFQFCVTNDRLLSIQTYRNLYNALNDFKTKLDVESLSHIIESLGLVKRSNTLLFCRIPYDSKEKCINEIYEHVEKIIIYDKILCGIVDWNEALSLVISSLTTKDPSIISTYVTKLFLTLCNSLPNSIINEHFLFMICQILISNDYHTTEPTTIIWRNMLSQLFHWIDLSIIPCTSNSQCLMKIAQFEKRSQFDFSYDDLCRLLCDLLTNCFNVKDNCQLLIESINSIRDEVIDIEWTLESIPKFDKSKQLTTQINVLCGCTKSLTYCTPLYPYVCFLDKCLLYVQGTTKIIKCKNNVFKKQYFQLFTPLFSIYKSILKDIHHQFTPPIITNTHYLSEKNFNAIDSELRTFLIQCQQGNWETNKIIEVLNTLTFVSPDPTWDITKTVQILQFIYDIYSGNSINVQTYFQ
ncbi:hypothetical protein QTN25_001351 [Entamoeba marina]